MSFVATGFATGPVRLVLPVMSTQTEAGQEFTATTLSSRQGHLSEPTLEPTPELLAELAAKSAEFETATPQEIIRWAVEEFRAAS